MDIEKFRDWFWPQIDDARSAKKAMKQGWLACAVCAGYKTLFVLINLAPGSDLFDVILFSIIGFGIFKFSRFATVCAVGMYANLKVMELFEHPGSFFKGLIFTAVIMAALVNSVRGAFVYYTIRSTPSSLDDQDGAA